jgi:hypothetical protein
MADHNSGINALPRWDAANPKSYSYDPKNYDRQDYARFKEARAVADKARVAKSQAALKAVMRDAGRVVPDKIAQLTGKRRRTGVLTVDTPSTCFASIEWEPYDDDPENGIATGEFFRGGALVYSGEMSRDEFEAWAEDPSPGGFYNAEKPF